MVKFTNKLKAVRKALKIWNRTHFGKVDQKVKLAEDRVMETEIKFDMDPTEPNKLLLCEAKRELDNRLQIKELFWRQKPNIRWLKEGDLNTRLFHQSVCHRRKKLCIHQIKNKQGQLLTEQ